MEEKRRKFESGHPDIKTRANGGKRKQHVGALGTLDFDDSFGLGGEIPNNKEKMIRSVEIRDYDGDVSRRWYVEYYELDPQNGKWRRRREYGFVNRLKDPLKRKERLQDLCAQVMTSLVSRVTNTRKGESEIFNYIQAYLKDKQASLRYSSMSNMKLSLKYFYKFLREGGYDKLPIHSIKKEHIHDFRKAVTAVTGNRSVNNHISDVRSFFNYFIQNYDDILYKNPCSGIKKLPTASETHVAYSDSQVKEYWGYLAKHNPGLLLYCQFVGLGFIRCEEARQLRVGDIDFEKRTISMWAGYTKTRRRVVKPLLAVFFDILMTQRIHTYPAEYFIFSYEGTPGEKQVHYNYFSRRFKKIKDKFKIARSYTIYGFRHTSVSQMIENDAPWREIMKYTGHDSMTAFEKYARSLANKPARDLSKYLNL